MTSLHKQLRHLIAFHGGPNTDVEQCVGDIEKLYQKAVQDLLNFELEQKIHAAKYGHISDELVARHAIRKELAKKGAV